MPEWFREISLPAVLPLHVLETLMVPLIARHTLFRAGLRQVLRRLIEIAAQSRL